MLHVGRDATLRDVDFYAFDESVQRWIGPRRFDAMWKVAGIDAATVRELHDRLGRDASMRTSWGAASNGWPEQGSAMSGMWRARWRIAWCAQVELTSGFEGCAGIGRRVALTRLGVLAGALAAVVALGLLIAVIIRTAASVDKSMPTASKRDRFGADVTCLSFERTTDPGNAPPRGRYRPRCRNAHRK